jgi:putative glycosyltransferase (TIGR04372 family)
MKPPKHFSISVHLKPIEWQILIEVMSVSSFLRDQLGQIRSGDSKVVVRKLKRASAVVLSIPVYILALPLVGIIRLISPWYLVRFGVLLGSRMGHFAANTELYLCEVDAGINRPRKPFLDIFFVGYKPVCNDQLVKMWKRVLAIGPEWMLHPITRINKFFPGWQVHEITNTQHDRDVHNLLDQYPPHLKFTADEERKGALGLLEMGIPAGAPFVCLLVRDSAYLPDKSWSYHNYRDCSIGNYVLASEALARKGYYVIRMGAAVHAPLDSNDPRVIDYAWNGMRSDFMDIYLGAKCSFCISTSSGWDAIPLIFRKPIVYTPIVPLGYFFTFSDKYMAITKHHIDIATNKALSLSEIFERGVGYSMYSSDYEAKGIRLVENTPDEIMEAVMEFEERLMGTWKDSPDDNALQNKFWKIFPVNSRDSKGIQLHGEIRSRFSISYLRKNSNWVN